MFLQLIVRVGLMLLVAIALAGSTLRSAGASAPQTDTEQIPIFDLDASWPKPLPNNWGFGETWGIAVDSRDHPWVLQSTTQKDPTIRTLLVREGKRLGPPVMEFDFQGNLVQAWGDISSRVFVLSKPAPVRSRHLIRQATRDAPCKGSPVTVAPPGNQPAVANPRFVGRANS